MSDRRGVTEALLILLRGAAPFPVGDHEAPPEEAGKPWAVVYSIDGGELMDGNLAAREFATDLVYQVTSVGRRRDQTEWAADLVRRTVLARSSTGFQVAWPAMTSGLAVVDRQLVGGPGGVEPAGDPPYRVNSVAERYLIRLTN